MDAKELIAQRLKVQEQIDALLAKDVLSADDRAQVKTLEANFEKLSADIAAAEQQAKDDADLRQRAKQRADMLSKSAGRKTQPDSLSTTTTDTTTVRVKDPEGFQNLGEQLQAIAGVALSGREIRPLKWENLSPITGGAVAGVPSTAAI
jgi:septal ring factor EnvC (AmiA/AmiB activator)